MNEKWIVYLIVVSLLSILFLAGCAEATPLVVALPPTKTLNAVPTITPTPARIVKSEKPTETVTSTSTTSPTKPQPTQLSFQVCSPLDWETIPELFEIVSDPYKPPPEERAEERHHGVDFSHYSRKGHTSIEGEPVRSILPGVVVASINDRLPYGNMVIIETAYTALPVEFAQSIGLQVGHSLYVLYAHFRQPPLVSLGNIVSCGQKVGEVGAVGYNVVNAHLHLETRSGPPGAVFTSMAFYTTTASVEEMENYTRWRTGGEFQHFDPMIFFQKYLDWQSISNP